MDAFLVGVEDYTNRDVSGRVKTAGVVAARCEPDRARRFPI